MKLVSAKSYGQIYLFVCLPASFIGCFNPLNLNDMQLPKSIIWVKTLVCLSNLYSYPSHKTGLWTAYNKLKNKYRKYKIQI